MRRPNQLSKRLTLALLALASVAGCAGTPGPDPRNGFAERNVGKTLVIYPQGAGTQVVYLGEGGDLFLWSADTPNLRQGTWTYELLPTGGTTSYQGAGTINQQVATPETAWGICLDAPGAGQVPPPPDGGDRTCALLGTYEAQVTERAQGDAFGLSSGQAPGAIPPGRQLTAADLAALR